MATSNRIGGMLSFYADGVQYEARGEFKVTGPKLKREGVSGQDFVHGYTEMPIIPRIEGRLSIGNNLSIELLESLTNVTVQANLANGNSYVLTQAWTLSAFVIDTVQGSVEIVLEGISLQELT